MKSEGESRVAVPSSKSHSCCPQEPHSGKKKINPLLLTLLALALCYGLSFLWEPFEAFRHTFNHYAALMVVPLFLGLLLGGVVDRYIPQSYISKTLARKSKRTIGFAVCLGFLMSGCSHGILALAIQLHKKGASPPAVIAFLLATPWANLTITILLIGFFGFKAFLIIGSALLVAVSTGFMFQWLDHKGLIETNPNTLEVENEFSIRGDIKKRWQESTFSWARLLKDAELILKGAWSLSKMLLWWVLFGVLLASLAGAFIPTHYFQQYLGASFVGLLITLVFATVIEVCSEGSSPLAFEIFKQTGALGNAFVFLMGGVVTDYTEIGLIWQNIGKKTALWLIALTVPQVVLLGWIFNVVF